MGKTRKQRGGDLYKDVNQISVDEITRVFTGGRELPAAERPFFILKWGPPGSGKSSETVRSTIESLGVPLENYMDYSPDKIIENLLPFRFESSMAKAEHERLKVELSVAYAEQDSRRRDFASIRQALTTYIQDIKGRYTNKNKESVSELLTTWKKGAPPPSIGPGFERVLLDKTKSAYNYYRTRERNAGGLTIRDKMREVLNTAFSKKIHIQYETSGSGYGDTQERQKLLNQFSPHRILRATGKPLSYIDIFINNYQELLGTIEYDERTKSPLRIKSLTPYSIPMEYRIVVVYPLVRKELILQRAEERANRMFLQKTPEQLHGDPEEYRQLLTDYANDLFIALGGPKPAIKELVDAALEKEGFVDSIEDLAPPFGPMSKEATFPFYRSPAREFILDSIEQAFQYSIDYFLKQYLIIGRIEKVVYVNTETT